MAYPLRVAARGVPLGTSCSEDSMAEIAVDAPERVCDLRQRIQAGFRWPEVCAGAQYRSPIAELSGFARVRCPSDAD
ncbi:hypothetical protein ACIQAC_26915 [Streptomyces sp. NPDC088387]|uniref:hypothetical protein n=1 Tax=Streptomyces sp. NPDC088387 TaxID=3365859 RepID=UPI00380547A1